MRHHSLCRRAQRQSSPNTSLRQMSSSCSIAKEVKAKTKSLSVMVFGSSTGVGKTIISAGLCRAALYKEDKVCYIKPVQTGELDEFFVQLYTNPQGTSEVFTRTLYHWLPAMSPHLAALQSKSKGGQGPVGDKELVRHLVREMAAFTDSHIAHAHAHAHAHAKSSTATAKPFVVVETAGGVLSPGPSATLQADVYRALRLPIVLVGDAKIGGITTTLCAYESLRLRGYTVHAIAMIDQPGSDVYGRNEIMVQAHLEETLSGIQQRNELKKECDGRGSYNNSGGWSTNIVPKVFSMSALPKEPLLHAWFRENETEFVNMYHHLEMSTNSELQNLLEMREKGMDAVWWPFTQHTTIKSEQVSFIESAHGDKFRILSPPSHSDSGPPSSTISFPPSLKSLISTHSSSSSTSSSSSPSSNSAIAEMRDLFDACASWWTQGVGHGNANMALAIAEAAGRYGHVMFPSNLHPPAVQLSRYMLESHGPGSGWASRVFFSDDGSTAMEIALKMALRLDQTRRSAAEPKKGQDREIIVLTQEGCYHGDTLGTMDASEPSVYNAGQHPWYTPRAVSIPLPLVLYRKGHLQIDTSALLKLASKEIGVGGEDVIAWNSVEDIFDVDARSGSALDSYYQGIVRKVLMYANAHATDGNNHVQGKPFLQRHVAALIIEPLLVGAGGLRFVDPLFQKVLVKECRKQNIPIVFDEVASGMWRLGPVSIASILKETPDVASYGKMLSGGYLPLALTLATDETYSAFLGSERSQALMHGHSYTANPLCCAAALEAIRLFEKCPNFDKSTRTMANCFTFEEISELSKLPGVLFAMGHGSVLAITMAPYFRSSAVSPPTAFGSLETNERDQTSSSQAATSIVHLMRADGVYARPLGNVVYVMPSPLSTYEENRRLVRVLRRCLTKAFYAQGVVALPNAVATTVV